MVSRWRAIVSRKSCASKWNFSPPATIREVEEYRVELSDVRILELVIVPDICQFCKQHRSEIVGRRLKLERLSFVQTFVFPPSHLELLAVREAKKEQAAYDTQIRKEARSEPDDEDELNTTA
jgi:hypothetical protein